MANSNSESWNPEYAEYLMAEKIVNFDSKGIGELSNPILTKNSNERRLKNYRKKIARRRMNYVRILSIILMV